jgi:hypothetical protein
MRGEEICSCSSREGRSEGWVRGGVVFDLEFEDRLSWSLTLGVRVNRGERGVVVILKRKASEREDGREE